MNAVDTITNMIEREIKEVATVVLEEEIEKATTNLRKRIANEVSGVTVSVLKNLNIEVNQTEFRVGISMRDMNKEPNHE